MKDKIIEKTIEMIETSNGDIADISIRKIAKELNIAVGLVNYHFGSKDDLIELCVERIIAKQVSIHKQSSSNDKKEIAYQTAIEVADYLWSNKAVSKISILSDLKKPNQNDNSMKSVRGMTFFLEDDSRKFDVFLLVSTMQTIFLKEDIVRDLGFNLSIKEERDRLMKYLVNKLLF